MEKKDELVPHETPAPAPTPTPGHPEEGAEHHGVHVRTGVHAGRDRWSIAHYDWEPEG